MSFNLSAFADEVSNELNEQIRFLNDRDIGYLEIRSLDGKNVGDLTLSEAKETYKRLADKGIKVWSVGSRIGKIGITDDFAPHLDEFKRTLEITDTLGCNKIRMFSFYIPKDSKADVYRDSVMERLERFLECSKGSGILLCHENEKGIYGDNAERCLDIAKTFSDMKLVFDPANFVQCGVDTLAAWEMLKGYLEYVHIKDALADGSIVPSGNGIGNIPQILADYEKMGGGVLTLEPHLTVFKGLASLEREGEKTKQLFEYPDAETAFVAAVDALRTIISKI